MPTSEIKDDAVLLNGKIHSLPITKEYVLSELNFVFEGISKLPGSRVLNPCNTLPPPPSPLPQGSSGEEKEKAFKGELERWCSLGIIEPVEGHTD